MGSEIVRAAGLFAAAVLSITFSARADVQYQLDDGSANVRTTPRFAAEMLWGNLFEAQPGGGVITSVSASFGRVPANTPIRVWVFDDPNDDWDPRDAVLRSVSDAIAGSTSQTVLTDYPITPVSVSGVFFVAISCQTDGGTNAVPARLDPVDLADPTRASLPARSWIFAADAINPNNLGASPYIANMTQNVPQGVFMIRATGVPGAGSGALGLGLLALAARRRRA
jgi:hypothetical protein